jgi:hypothetical protein
MTPGATAPRVSDLFLRLSDDPGLLADYGRDPKGTMAAAGLSRGQIATVLSGAPKSVRDLIDAELAADPARRDRIVIPRMVIMAEPEEPEEPEPEEPEPEEPEPERPGPTPEPPEREPSNRPLA